MIGTEEHHDGPILPGFEATGTARVNRELPLNNGFTGELTPSEESTFPSPRDAARVLERALVTRDD
jgi:hypothetical protein